MKVINHELHGYVLRPASFNELLIEVNRPSGKYNHRVWMWRGQSKIDWRLDSSAYRRIKASTGYHRQDINEELIAYEKTLLEHATHRGYRLEDSHLLSDFELLAKLQHHGAATRLVDFTRNALIGIWFACHENQSESGLLIGYDSWYLEGYEKTIEHRKYEEVISSLRVDPVTWEPPSISPRVAVQHSQFIYSKVVDNNGGSLAIPSEEEAFRKFEVTKKVKAEAA